MDDAQRSMVALMRRAWPAGGGLATPDTTAVPQRPEPADPPKPAADDRQGLEHTVATLLEQGRPEAAVRFFDQALARSIKSPWVACDRAAGALLCLGYPDAARAIWTQAVGPPSRALRLTRIATADLAALDHESALHGYRAALDHDPSLGEALFGLALLHTQLGRAAPALAAARQGVSCRVTDAQKSFLSAIEAFVAPYAAK